MKTFREAFCDYYACPPKRFARKVFWIALPGYVRPLAAIVCLFHRRFFRRDFEAIEILGDTRDTDDFTNETESLYDLSRFEQYFLRRRLKLRMSGRKLQALRRRVYELE
ncbi:MAG TPA: hypothetical protein P5555_08615 [Candidatus Paceibacterota bacterium]|nr:hypothetical protein [Verrucomicrobiota bacterium]HOX02559.1 hypothetical protein [Verrucomicrobiota bacterium]HRZ45235.1 hypothetical protein [Candidatus Paceibacterota bacterium]HRZ94168.1 hypothetical protein [Candidatus Paceibacterota bacterium]